MTKNLPTLMGKDRIYNEIVDLGAYEGGCINYEHLKVIANEKYVFYGDTLRESLHILVLIICSLDTMHHKQIL